MKYLKEFNTESERQSCTDEYKYVSYTEETHKVHAMNIPFFCKLTLSNNEVIEIKGHGVLTRQMFNNVPKNDIVKMEIGELCTTIYYTVISSMNNLTTVIIGNNVSTIYEGNINNCSLLTNIVIGTHVGFITISTCHNLTSITCLNPNAPTTFNLDTNTTGTLYVP